MIVLSQEVRDAIVAHARDGAPMEVCGVLAGTRGPDGSRVERASRTPNVASSPRVTYESDPEALFETIQDVEGDGLDVVGFYHSHPSGPPRPSPTDVAEATWEGHSYAIVVPGNDPTVRSWRWTGEGFEGERVEIA